MIKRLLLALTVAVAAVACADDPTTPTAPTPTVFVVGPVTSTFTSRLPLGGSVTRSFTTSANGQVTVILKSTTPSTTIGLGLGIPLGTNPVGSCRLTVSTETAGAATPQLTTFAESGTYCIVVWDLGSQTGAVDFDAAVDYTGIKPKS